MRVLLLEDEAISRQFLQAVLTDVATVVPCGDCASARQLATAEGFDLLLLDLHLPDGDGVAWLAALRADAAAASRRAHAIALTAELDHAREAELIRSGFDSALAKPITAEALLDAVRRAATGPAKVVTWDDAAALRAVGGNAANVQALRQLLRRDLPEQQARILAALDRGEHAALAAELHRLRAAAGFCGASELGSAVAALAEDRRADTRQRFIAACAAVLAPIE